MDEESYIPKSYGTVLFLILKELEISRDSFIKEEIKNIKS
jgi:hypothetical protein